MSVFTDTRSIHLGEIHLMPGFWASDDEEETCNAPEELTFAESPAIADVNHGDSNHSPADHDCQSSESRKGNSLLNESPPRINQRRKKRLFFKLYHSDKEVRVEISAKYTNQKLEEFLCKLFDGEFTRKAIRLETRDGFIVPVDWEDLDDGETYIVFPLSDSSQTTQGHAETPLRQRIKKTSRLGHNPSTRSKRHRSVARMRDSFVAEGKVDAAADGTGIADTVANVADANVADANAANAADDLDAGADNATAENRSSASSSPFTMSESLSSQVCSAATATVANNGSGTTVAEATAAAAAAAPIAGESKRTTDTASSTSCISASILDSSDDSEVAAPHVSIFTSALVEGPTQMCHSEFYTAPSAASAAFSDVTEMPTGISFSIVGSSQSSDTVQTFEGTQFTPPDTGLPGFTGSPNKRRRIMSKTETAGDEPVTDTHLSKCEEIKITQVKGSIPKEPASGVASNGRTERKVNFLGLCTQHGEKSDDDSSDESASDESASRQAVSDAIRWVNTGQFVVPQSREPHNGDSQNRESCNRGECHNSPEGLGPKAFKDPAATDLENHNTSNLSNSNSNCQQNSSPVPQARDFAADAEGGSFERMHIFKRVPGFTLGFDHPDALAEADTLASVELPSLAGEPVLRIPMEIAENGLLSNPQLQTVAYAARSFRKTLKNGSTQGFYLGDGTGCGKGRVIAASIYHLWNSGFRRHLWVSLSADLIQDAIRDLTDIGAGHIPVVDLNTTKTEDLDSPSAVADLRNRAAKLNSLWRWNGEGIIFVTYSLLSRLNSGKKREPYLDADETKLYEASSSTSVGGTSSIVEGDNDNGPENATNFHLSSPDASPVITIESEDEDIWTPVVPPPLDAVKSSNVVSRLGQLLKWMSKAPPDSTHQLTSTERAKLLHFLKKESKETSWKTPYWMYKPPQVRIGGLVCFDEAHKAKNLIPGDSSKHTGGSSTGLIVKRLQDFLRHCPVMYSSATGASELRNIAYMTRLGLWGPKTAFESFSDFRDSVERGGVAALECLAMDLRAAGLYSCRSLSYTDVKFNTAIVSMDRQLTDVYNGTSQIMLELLRAMNSTRFVEASLRGQYWAVQQRVFKQLLVAQKIKHAVRAAKDYAAQGCQVVISLWGTGESRTVNKLKNLKSALFGEEAAASRKDSELLLEEFLSPPQLMLEKFVGEQVRRGCSEIADEIIDGLLASINSLPFPSNPIDDLIDESSASIKFQGLIAINALWGRWHLPIISDLQLGGPRHVAELSGRSKRFVIDKNSGKMRYVNRDCGCNVRDLASSGVLASGFTSVNLQEQELFQRGRKRFAIITEAASAGISLHADGRRKNSRPRVMICVELSWAADKAVQQFGRIHRSNQVHSPRYELLISDVGGEQRFIGCIAKRLRTLGAITRGNRHMVIGTGGNASSGTQGFFDMDVYSHWGEEARKALLKWIDHYALRKSDALPPFYWAVPQSVLSHYSDPSAFAMVTNQLMEQTALQNHVMDFFTAIYNDIIEAAKLNGDYDEGLEDLSQVYGSKLNLTVESKEVLYRHPESGAASVHYVILVDRGISWLQAVHHLENHYRQYIDHLQRVKESAGTDSGSPKPIKGSSDSSLSPLVYASLVDGSFFGGFFWLPAPVGGGRPTVALALQDIRMRSSSSTRLVIYKPHLGCSHGMNGVVATPHALYQQQWRKVSLMDFQQCQNAWEDQYVASETHCLHTQVGKACRKGAGCRIGRRIAKVHLLTGNLISLWGRLEKWLYASADDTSENDTTVAQRNAPLSTAKRSLKLIAVPRDRDGPTLIGVRLPAAKVPVILRHLKKFADFTTRAKAPSLRRADNIQRLKGLEFVYRETTIIRLLTVLTQILNAEKLGGSFIEIETLYSLVMNELDRNGTTAEHEHATWKSNEVALINVAFQPTEEGISSFRTFLSLLSYDKLVAYASNECSFNLAAIRQLFVPAKYAVSALRQRGLERHCQIQQQLTWMERGTDAPDNLEKLTGLRQQWSDYSTARQPTFNSFPGCNDTYADVPFTPVQTPGTNPNPQQQQHHNPTTTYNTPSPAAIATAYAQAAYEYRRGLRADNPVDANAANTANVADTAFACSSNVANTGNHSSSASYLPTAAAEATAESNLDGTQQSSCMQMTAKIAPGASQFKTGVVYDVDSD